MPTRSAPVGQYVSIRPHVQGHDLLHDMLAVSSATHVAAADGFWSAPGTWGGLVPSAGSRVVIPNGRTVTLDVSTADLNWVHLDGSLVFQPDAVTDLRLDTLAVFDLGYLEIGSETDPITASATVTIVPRHGKPINQFFDPDEISRGLIVMGGCRMHGMPVTPYVTLGEVPAGTSVVTVDQAPVNWQLGDRVVLAGGSYGEDESFTIAGLIGSQVTLDHPTVNPRTFPIDPQTGSPYPECRYHLMHTPRNVVLRSEVPYTKNDFQSAAPVLQGHSMFMRSAGIDLRWVELQDMGRTTVNPVTDPIVYPDGSRLANLAVDCNVDIENRRARYGLHFHKCRPYNPPAYLQGISVHCQRDAGLKVGIDNHSSNVICEDSVSWQIDGSHFFTEEGDEIGAFRRCGAIYSNGSNAANDVQPDDNCLKQNYNQEHYAHRRQDYGHTGFGFWIHSGGIDSEDLWAQGHSECGFTLFTELLSKGRKQSEFPTIQHVTFDLGLHRSAPGDGTPPTWAIERWSHLALVPGRAVNLQTYANKANKWNNGVRNNRRRYAFMVWTHGKDTIDKPWPEDPPRNQFHNWLGWRTEGGVITGYSGWADYRNILLIRDGYGGGGAGSSFRARGMSLHGQSGNSTDVTDTRIDGFDDPIFVGPNSVLTNVTADGELVSGSQMPQVLRVALAEDNLIDFAPSSARHIGLID